MTLQQLKYFITVVEKGSISKAAESLFIAQPSLTAAIQKLEEEFQLKLFKRTNKGVVLSHEGEEFLGYARQILLQVNALESKYVDQQDVRRDFSVSSQHLHFANNAYINLLKRFDLPKYRFNLIETSTYNVIENVASMISEIGVLGYSEFSQEFLFEIFERKNLIYTELAVVPGRIFVSDNHPLYGRKSVQYEDLYEYPCIIYDQGEQNALYLSESSPKVMNHPKQIHITDRGTSFQLMRSLNAFTTDTGVVIDYADEFPSILLEPAEERHVGYLTHKNLILSDLGEAYIDEMKRVVEQQR